MFFELILLGVVGGRGNFVSIPYVLFSVHRGSVHASHPGALGSILPDPKSFSRGILSEIKIDGFFVVLACH